jgi:hypothetical protein
LGYSLFTIDILKIINIQNCQTGYYLTDEDVAFICNTLNKNLIIIHEDHRENEVINSALIYWKSNGPVVCIFHEQNHWRPGIFNNNKDSKIRIHNSCICYEFPSQPNFVKTNITEINNTKNNKSCLTNINSNKINRNIVDYNKKTIDLNFDVRKMEINHENILKIINQIVTGRF